MLTVQWSWGGSRMCTALKPWRWSSRTSVEKTTEGMQKAREKKGKQSEGRKGAKAILKHSERPVRVRVHENRSSWRDSWTETTDSCFDDVDGAIRYLASMQPLASTSTESFQEHVNVPSMKAIVRQGLGRNIVWKTADLPKPCPQEREILVRVHASGMNGFSLNLEQNETQCGRASAGEVVEVGPGCGKYMVGDQVYFLTHESNHGTHADFLVVRVDMCSLKPDSLSFAEAAVMPRVFLTAWTAMSKLMHIRPGRGGTILIVGGASEVGSIAIQMASRVLGLTVVATAGRAATEAFCRNMGARNIVDHKNDIEFELSKIGFLHVDYVLNCGGWDENDLQQWVQVLRPGGHIVSIEPLRSALDAEHLQKITTSCSCTISQEVKLHVDIRNYGDLLDQLTKLFDGGILQHTLTLSLPFTEEGLLEGNAQIKSGTTQGSICIVHEVPLNIHEHPSYDE